MSIFTHWASPPQKLSSSLIPGTVHVWRTQLDDSSERVARLRRYLSAEEQTRADRCRIPHPQYQFVVTRGILRTLLSRYIGVSPSDVHFMTQSQGKPMLRTPSFLPIQFNVSHTKGMALIAITLEHPIGIDVEWIDRKTPDKDIAERYFSAQESAYLASLPQPERTHQFFSYWTCKEAYLKMKGTGITGGLDRSEILMEPDQNEVQRSSLNQEEKTEDFLLYRMTVSPEHVGAVAIACSSTQISYWNWHDDYGI